MKKKYKYTIKEIDNLREELIRRDYAWTTIETPVNLTPSAIHIIEDKLRTYMKAGIRAKDMKKIVKEERKKYGLQ